MQVVKVLVLSESCEKSYFRSLERLLLDRWKVSKFALTTLRDLFKKLVPIFIQSKLKLKLIVIRSHTLSRTSYQLHVFALSFDWFAVLSVPFVIG